MAETGVEARSSADAAKPLDVAARCRARRILADVTLEADALAMVEQARASKRAIDTHRQCRGRRECAHRGLDSGHWQRMLAVNLTGAFFTVRAALPDLLRPDARLPRIVFIASTAGIKGYAYAAAYCAAKHGVVGLARALAAELAPRVSPAMPCARLHRDAVVGGVARQDRGCHRPSPAEARPSC